MKKILMTLLFSAFVAPMAFAYVAPKTKHPEPIYNKIKVHCTLLPKVGQIDVSDADNNSRSRWSDRKSVV